MGRGARCRRWGRTAPGGPWTASLRSARVPRGSSLAGLVQALGGQVRRATDPPAQARGRPCAATPGSSSSAAARPGRSPGALQGTALNPESVSTQLCPSPTGCTASSWPLLAESGLPGRASCHALWLLCHQRPAGGHRAAGGAT